MRFEFYHEGLDDVPKLAVDGTVPKAIHFSHWQGNETPPEVKADTSTEIALNVVASPERERLTGGVELITNNHFDTDGVLSVWTLLTGERALPLRDALIRAAESGDFSEYTGEDAIRASICIQGSDQPISNKQTLSPLADHLAGRAVMDESEAYGFVLPEVERVLTRTRDYEPLWRDAWARIASAIESFESGASKVEEDEEARLSIVTLAPQLFAPNAFDPLRHTVPSTAISKYARGRVYLISIPMSDGWAYRLDYPYYSWAETVVRPPITRHDFSPLVETLNELERNQEGRWQTDNSELSSAVKYLDKSGVLIASGLTPDVIAREASARLAPARAEARVG
jgi:hypothetical protein